MNNVVLNILLVLFSANIALSQSNFVNLQERVKSPNNIFIEFGGVGYTGSINYERSIYADNYRRGLSLGVGVIPWQADFVESRYPVIPLRASFFFQKERSRYSIGYGILPISDRIYHPDLIVFEWQSYHALILGFRYAPPESKLHLGFSLLGFFTEDVPLLAPWFAFKFGYSFGKTKEFKVNYSGE